MKESFDFSYSFSSNEEEILKFWDENESFEKLREKNKDGKFFYFSTKATKIYSQVEYPDNCYLVFGKETAGLPEDLLFANKESCVRLPMINNSSARSLNLSNTVAIGVYEVLRQWNFPDLLLKGKLTKFDWDKSI